MKFKHCHFAILYNELPFLKQKLPFLYTHFDQLIFFDLNVGVFNPHFSTDGSHEFIRDYPDPQKKITLIEKTDLSDVARFCGAGSVEKQKMFAVGSSYVQDDVDVFWCTDMDEFFHKDFIQKVEQVFLQDAGVNSVDMRHYMFWKNLDLILCSEEDDGFDMYSRVCRHKSGNLYGHCSIHQQFPKNHIVLDNRYYHFAWVGENRVINKLKHYSEPPTGNPAYKEMYDNYLKQVWNKTPTHYNIPPGKVIGAPYMHPNMALQKGIKKFTGTLPPYINVDQLLKELYE